MIPPSASYPKPRNCIVTVFDLRFSDAAERLHRERAVWQDCADLEMLDVNHAVLIVRPGAAARLAA